MRSVKFPRPPATQKAALLHCKAGPRFIIPSIYGYIGPPGGRARALCYGQFTPPARDNTTRRRPSRVASVGRCELTASSALSWCIRRDLYLSDPVPHGGCCSLHYCEFYPSHVKIVQCPAAFCEPERLRKVVKIESTSTNGHRLALSVIFTAAAPASKC